MNLIEERDKRTIYRKLRKKQYDEMITLAADDSIGRFRLLDEGAVVDAHGDIDFYIKKGTLRKFYEGLSDDYEGAVKFAHHQLATFPIMIGRWTKNDLHLVDIGGGREGLDVDVRLDKSLNLVQDLLKMPFTLGISAEIKRHFDAEATERLRVPITDGIDLKDYGIVGEAGNVNSSNINLQEGVQMNVKDLSELLEKEQEKVTDLAAINDLMDKALSVAEEAGEEVTESAEETAEETAEVSEASSEEPAEEPAEASAEESAEAAEEPVDATEEATEDEVSLSAIEALIEDLRKDNEALKAQLSEVTAKLAVKEKAESDFIAKFKNLSVSLAEEKKPEVTEHRIGMTNGIGAL